MKKLLKIVGVILAILIIAAIALPMLISAEYLKSQMVAQVKTATGRDLTIGGKASLSVFPNIAVSVEDVTLGNPAGFSSKYFAHVDKLTTGAALGPLLHKQLQITGIDVEGAVLNIETNAAGAKNTDFSNGKPATPEAAAKPKQAGEKASPLKQLAIGDVTLKNSTVTIIKAGAKPLAVSDINLTISGADGSKPLKIDGAAKHQGEVVKLAVALEKSKDFLAGKTSPVALSAELPSGKVAFKGTAVNQQSISADGMLDVGIDDLPKLIGWATGKPASAGLPKKITLKSGVFMQNDKAYALKNASFSADALSASGSLAISLEGAVPNLQGNLKFALLDLDALTKSNGKTVKENAAAAPAAAKSDAWSDAPIDGSGLRAVNGNVKVQIDQLKSGTIEVSNIAADVVMGGGVMKLALGNASLYSGTAKGSVNLDGSGPGIGLGTNLTLSGVQIEPLMVAVSGASRLQGTATLGLNVTGHGASQRAIVSSLGGSGTMRINDGAIKGINVASFLRDAKKGFVMGEKTTESTDFTELTATYKIVQGIVSNDDLAMKSPVLRLSGKGTISLPARTIHYRAVPSVVGTLKGQGGKDKLSGGGVDIPLLITGPWSAISVTPDVAGLLQDAIRNPDALKQNIEDITGMFKKKKAADAAAPAVATTAPAASPATTPAPAAPAPESKKDAQQRKAAEAIGGLLNSFGK